MMMFIYYKEMQCILFSETSGAFRVTVNGWRGLVWGIEPQLLLKQRWKVPLTSTKPNHQLTLAPNHSADVCTCK